MALSKELSAALDSLNKEIEIIQEMLAEHPGAERASVVLDEEGEWETRLEFCSGKLCLVSRSRVDSDRDGSPRLLNELSLRFRLEVCRSIPDLMDRADELESELPAEVDEITERLRAIRESKNARNWNGYSGAALVRWMGKEGWTKEEVTSAIKSIGLRLSDDTIRIQIKKGKTAPKLAPEQAEELHNLRFIHS